jgi:splicing factor 3A subunit 2
LFPFFVPTSLPLLAHPASTLLSPSDLLQQNVDRRERLRRLALETIDITKDPYFMRNHLGQYECRLCLTVHKNEGNYLAHTQGRRHQGSLAKRAAREAERSQGSSATAPRPASVPVKKGGVKIGRPGYRVTKQFDPERNQRSLLFQIEYPEISGGSEPRHRFMSCFEQRKEAPDRAWQYVLFAAEPYETIAFKVPNAEVERGDAFFVHWDSDAKIFSVQLPFRPGAKVAASGGFGAGGSNRAAMMPPPPPPPPPPPGMMPPGMMRFDGPPPPGMPPPMPMMMSYSPPPQYGGGGGGGGGYGGGGGGFRGPPPPPRW